MMIRHWCGRIGVIVACVGAAVTAQAQVAAPPPGFVALFDGKSLAGWRGGDTFDHRKLLAMPAEERAAQIQKWTTTMTDRGAVTGKPHWSVENGELVNDGFGAYATTEKDYGDFELLVEYKTVPKADSGVYLRGVPQVQIWDWTNEREFKNGAQKGSGGLWNNSPGRPGKDPLVRADRPFGEWNALRIIMVGSRVSVWLNGTLVVDHAVMENYYDRSQPIPVRGPIQLQTHGGEIRWRNVFLREIGQAEATRILLAHQHAGFVPVFNGKDFTGWSGPTDNYEIVDGSLRCKPGKGGTIYTTAEYTDFAVRLEFSVPKGGNNGLAIRYPGEGDTAYVGMCELQVLDDNYEAVTGSAIDPRQAHGSVYGIIPAARGFQRPAGEWNVEEVTVKGSRITVELNGFVILDGDVSTVTAYLADREHPGKNRVSGHFGFAGHNDPVRFRNVQIKPLVP